MVNSRSHETGAFGLIDGIIAVVVVALAGIALLVLNSNVAHSRAGALTTPALIAGENATTDLQAVAAYSGGATPVPYALKNANTVTITDFVQSTPTPFPGAIAKGIRMPPIAEQAAVASLTSQTYDANGRVSQGSMTVTTPNGSSATIPIVKIGQGTSTTADCQAAFAQQNLNQTTLAAVCN